MFVCRVFAMVGPYVLGVTRNVGYIRQPGEATVAVKLAKNVQ